MQLHGNDGCAGSHQLSRDHARAGAHVDDQIPRPYIGGFDQPNRPTLIELVPSPPAGVAGHGTPSSPSSRYLSPRRARRATDFRIASKSSEGTPPAQTPLSAARHSLGNKRVRFGSPAVLPTPSDGRLPFRGGRPNEPVASQCTGAHASRPRQRLRDRAAWPGSHVASVSRSQ